MTDLYSNIPDLAAEQEAILRRRKIAEAIQASAMSPIEQQPTVGRYVVPTSPLLGVGKVLEAYMAKKGLNEADTAQSGLANKASSMEADAVRKYKEKFSDKVNPYPVNDQMSPAAQQFAQTEGQQITSGDKRGAIIDALTSPYKGLNVMGQLDQKAIEAEANDKRDAAAAIELAKQKQLDRLAQIEVAAAGKTPAAAPAITAVTLQDPKDPNKTIVVDGRSGRVIGQGPKLTQEGKANSDMKRATAQDQQSALKALKEAGYDPTTGKDAVSDLIKKSTSGWMQKQGANLASVFDVTTEGRKALNTLSAASSKIVMQMMGGKLGSGISNADRDFVMAQLGDVSNPDKTSEERLAAWEYAKARMIGTGLLPDVGNSGNEKSSANPHATKTDAQIKAELGL